MYSQNFIETSFYEIVQGENLYNDQFSKRQFHREAGPQIKTKEKKIVNSLSKSRKGKYQNCKYAKSNHEKISKRNLKFFTP